MTEEGRKRRRRKEEGIVRKMRVSKKINVCKVANGNESGNVKDCTEKKKMKMYTVINAGFFRPSFNATL